MCPMNISCSHFLTLVPARGFFYPEDGGDTILRNVGSHKNYTSPGNGFLHSHRPENLKSYNLYVVPEVRAFRIGSILT
jgi:hypothetical protein